jgi:hypothetical protein
MPASLYFTAAKFGSGLALTVGGEGFAIRLVGGYRSLSPGDPKMKKVLFVICLLSATAAFAQYSGVGNSRTTEPIIYSSPSHPAHAGYVPMSSEQNILAGASYTSAQGERPASDFPQPEAIALGTAARDLKKQHAQMKKSTVVWVNQ